eukprot:g3394.t1
MYRQEEIRAKRVVLEESDSRAFSLLLYDSSGNVVQDETRNAQYHPETGSLPLVFTGNRTGVIENLPKETVYSLLSYGTTDAIGAHRFTQVVFDAGDSRVYMVEHGRNVSISLPEQPIVTTTHRRFVQAQNEGWNRTSSMPGKADGLWSVNTGIHIDVAPPHVLNKLYDSAENFERSKTNLDSDHDVAAPNTTLESHRPVKYGGARCIAVPTFIVSMPLPLYYWHTVAEGVFPLAHAVRKMQERLRDQIEDGSNVLPLIVLAQGWTERLVPRFLASMLRGLTPWPILDMQTLRAAGPTCFLDLTVGYYPQITQTSELRETIKWMLPLYGVRSDDENVEREADAVPVVTFIQRRSRCAASDRAWQQRMKSNATIDTNSPDAEHVNDRAARGIANVDDLASEARQLGAVVHVAALEQMSVRDQMSLFRHSDVVVAAHGSAWANTAFMREKSAAVQLYGFGVKNGCVCLVNMYRHTFEAMDDLCNGLIADFPSVTPGLYVEIMETDSAAHLPPFEFADEFCSDDPLKGENIAIHSMSFLERNETEESKDKDPETMTCREKFSEDEQACHDCERENEAHALEDPRWLWANHFHRAYRWFKGASFTVKPEIFRIKLHSTLRALDFDLLPLFKRRSENMSTTQITPKFGGPHLYDPPYLDGYIGPLRHRAVSCCNLSPEWVRDKLKDMRAKEVATLSLRKRSGDFEDMSLLVARELCDSSSECKGIAYSAMGALFKSSTSPLIEFSARDMELETGVKDMPATFYAKSGAFRVDEPFACDTLGLPKRLSLAFVHHFLPHGGVETIIHSITKKLTKGCFDVSVFVITDWMLPDGGPMRVPIEDAGANVEMWPLLTTHPPTGEPGHAGVSFPIDLSVLHDLLPRLAQYDVVHSFYGGAALSSVGLDTVGLTRVLPHHPVHINSIAAVIPLVPGHAHADAVVMDSVPSYNLIRRQLESESASSSLAGTRVELIEAGIDTLRFDPSKTEPWVPPPAGTDAGRLPNSQTCENVTDSSKTSFPRNRTVVVGFVGRMAHQKQPLLLVRVAAHIRRLERSCHCNSGDCESPPKIRFVMVGSGPLFDEVATLSGSLNASVELYASTPHVPEVLASFDVFVHLSIWDTAAYAVREAMAMQLPIVALRSNVGVADYVRNGKHGILTSDQDVETLSD